jgi:hypothetical protein
MPAWKQRAQEKLEMDSPLSPQELREFAQRSTAAAKDIKTLISTSSLQLSRGV